MNRQTFYLIAAASVSALFTAFIVGKYPATTPPAAVAAPAPILQKLRFGVICPDGSRVEYVATERLPKAEMCYPDPE